MPTIPLTIGTTRREQVEQAGVLALLGMVAAVQLSIAAAQILFATALLCWFASFLLQPRPFETPRFFWPLLAYAAASLLAATFSRDPAVSVEDCKQLVLFLIVPVVYDFARGARARTVVSVILTVGAASALVGIVQYGVLNYDHLGRRPQGTLSHWMTYSGTLMLVICAAIARLLYDSRDRAWALVVMPALLVGLVLTFTRSAWVGVSAGAAVLLLLKDFRLVGALPIVIAAMVALAPADLTDRVYSMFDLNDPTNRDRVAMLQAGAAIVRDYPLTGVGPDMIQAVYPEYRVATAVQDTNPHLHNVPMQIAAERGLPALLLWCAFLGAATAGAWVHMRRTRHKALAATALGTIAAMITAGQFEYNFGDSEFLMLFLVLLTLPFAADRDGGLP
ncbi:MAG: O-antigen ligase family protein [Vicinamibacterales bacterium]|nr:O-antigen ligase family protein [Vicinamibacterales bacterium]